MERPLKITVDRCSIIYRPPRFNLDPAHNLRCELTRGLIDNNVYLKQMGPHRSECDTLSLRALILC